MTKPGKCTAALQEGSSGYLRRQLGDGKVLPCTGFLKLARSLYLEKLLVFVCTYCLFPLGFKGRF